MTNLPIDKTQKFSDRDVNNSFENYYTENIAYSSNSLDATFNFFTNRGFDRSAAVATSTVLLEQAKRDDVNVFKLLDTLKGLSDVELSNVVTEILNYSRPKTSSLGYRRKTKTNLFEKRNIEQPEKTDQIQLNTGIADYIAPGYVVPGYVQGT